MSLYNQNMDFNQLTFCIWMINICIDIGIVVPSMSAWPDFHNYDFYVPSSL